MLAKVPLHGQNTDPKRVHGRNGIRVSVKARLVKSFQKRILNPFVKALVRRGAVDGWAIIETRGRKTGAPRETPVGNGLEGDTFWLVAEFGRAAAYVKNIEADPRVRVCVRGMWRTGRAILLPDDDTRVRQATLHRLNAAAVRVAGTDLLTVRVDLDRWAGTSMTSGARRRPRGRGSRPASAP
jgi:deazaflavin-dependent oxidoreductase (nitroreductase family)